MRLSDDIIANVKNELIDFYGDADEVEQILQRPDVRALLSADWSGPDSDNAVIIAASIDELVEESIDADLSNVTAVELTDIYQGNDKLTKAVSDANLEFGFLFKFKDGSSALYGFRPSSFGPGTLKYIDTDGSLNESWYNDDTDGRWHLIDRKAVMDSDGFYTEYSLYEHDDGRFATVFGDSDIYRPEDGDFDAEFDSEWEAREWFDDYRGPGEALDESLNKSGADFTVDFIKFLDDDLEKYEVIETIPVTVDNIIKLYGADAYRAAVKGITKEHVKDGIGNNWALGYLIKGVADRLAHKPQHRSEYGMGFDNIQVVNDNLFDSNITALQKHLGKLLLPPNGWTGVKESKKPHLSASEKKLEEGYEDSANKARMNAGIGNDFIEYLNKVDKAVNADFWSYDDKTFQIEVDGDWKHDHQACDEYLARFLAANGLKLIDNWTDVDDDEDDGDDSYRGIHYYMVAPQNQPIHESLADEPDIRHIDEILEGMNGNADDDCINDFLRTVNRIKRALKAKEQDIAVIISEDAYLEGGTPLDKKKSVFFIEDAPLAYETVNGNTWIYFPDEASAKSWWTGYSGQLDESWNDDDSFQDHVRENTDYRDVVKAFIENNHDEAVELANEYVDVDEDTDLVDVLMNSAEDSYIWDWYFDFFADELADEYEDRKAYERDPYSYYGVSRSDFF